MQLSIVWLIAVVMGLLVVLHSLWRHRWEYAALWAIIVALYVKMYLNQRKKEPSGG